MKMFKDSMIYVVGELISKAMPFALLPYLTRKLGVEGIGHLSFFLSLVVLFQIYIGFNQGGALARYFYTKGKSNVRYIFVVSLLHSATFSFISIFVVFYLSLSIEYYYCILISLFSSIVSLGLSYYQCQKIPKSYIKIQLLINLISLVGTIVTFELYSASVEDRLFWVLLSNVVVAVFLCVFVFFVSKFKRKVKILLIYWKYLFFFSYPLLLHSIASFGKTSLDRIVIYDKFSASVLGVYYTAFQVTSVISVVLMALNKALMPYYYERLKSNEITITNVSKYSKLSLFLPFVFAFFVSLLPESLYVFILGDGFEDIYIYIPIFTFSFFMAIPYYIIGGYLMYHGKNLKLSICTILSSFVHVGAVFVLSDYGIEYVAYASAISSVSLLLLLQVSIRKNEIIYHDGNIK